MIQSGNHIKDYKILKIWFSANYISTWDNLSKNLFSSPRAVHAQRLTTDFIRSWRT